MRWYLHRRGPNDPDPEFAVGILGVPVSAVVLAATQLVPSALVPVCRFHQVTSRPCLTCGVYRSLYALVRGDLVKAWLTQPLFVTLLAVAAVYGMYSVVVVVGKLPRVRVRFTSRRERWLAWAVLVFLVLANWVYLIVDGR
jgi:hypothetical protein